MNCPNPKCNTIGIPEDAKYCPNCGQLLYDIDALRKQVELIKQSNPAAFDLFCEDSQITSLPTEMKKEECDKVLSNKTLILEKQEILEELVKECEELINSILEDLRKQVEQIKQSCPDSFNTFSDQYLSTSSSTEMSIEDCKLVIANKKKIEEEQIAIETEEEERRQDEELRKRAKAKKEQFSQEHDKTLKIVAIVVWIVAFIVVFLLVHIIGGESMTFSHMIHPKFSEGLLAWLALYIGLPTIPTFIALELFDDRISPSTKQRISEFKKLHPEDPVCKYL